MGEGHKETRPGGGEFHEPPTRLFVKKEANYDDDVGGNSGGVMAGWWL